MSRFGIYAHSLLASGGSMAIGVVTSIVVTRFLVPDARGELASLFFIATTVSSLILAGASPQAITSHITQHPNDPGIRMARQAIRLQIALCLLAVPAFAYFFHIPGHHGWAAVIVTAALMSTLQIIYTGECAIRRGVGEFALISHSVMLIPLLYLLGLVAGFSLLGPSPLVAAAANIFPMLVVCIYLKASRKTGLPAPGSAMSVLHFFKTERSFVWLSLVALLINNLDKAMLLKMGTLQDMGLYAAAATFTAPVLVAGDTIANISFADIRARDSKLDAIQAALLRCRVMILLLGTMGLFIILAGPALLHAAFGKPYAAAGTTLQWLMLATVARGIAGVMDTNLRALGHLTPSLQCGLTTLCVLAVAAGWLIPSQGATGAAMACALGYSIHLVLLTVTWCKHEPSVKALDIWGRNTETACLLARSVKIKLSRS